MEQIRSLQEKYQRYMSERKQRRAEQEEAARRERVLNHRHTLGCKRSGDIERYNQTYETDRSLNTAFFSSAYFLQTYDSRCTECGEIEHHDVDEDMRRQKDVR